MKKSLFTCLFGFSLLLQAGAQKTNLSIADGPFKPTDESLKNYQYPEWFRDAKFGLFIHWGLYSQLGGTYKGKNYYGSGEWIMNRAKISANEYAEIAKQFNPVDFNAEKWAQFAKDIGARYVVITSKHHEGFSMYDSKISDFNIVKASPYGKDPMKFLSKAIRNKGLKFGFYYSQFLDWHEPNGGGNNWDFDENKKNYLKYYREKSIPQLKELLTNYGPLGLVWFDMPGGLSKEQTKKIIDSLHQLQPQALFSSRVGQGLGDYKDFGDSEIPPSPVADAWEAIYTHNDSWGYIQHDLNFKTPEELIRLLANVSSKGGNLMVNIGPDGKGDIPYYSQQYLLEVGKWLKKFGDAIYGTTYGIIAPQPWGVTTSKPGLLFLHVMQRPANGKLLVPGFNATITKVYQVDNKKDVKWEKSGTDLIVSIPELEDKRNTVFAVNYSGELTGQSDSLRTQIVSQQYNVNELEAINGTLSGNGKVETITYSYYFGDWKHTTCITGLTDTSDAAIFKLRITEPGDFKVVLEYTCPDSSKNQEGVVEFNDNNQQLYFRTLHTSEENSSEPVLFIKHAIGIVHVDKPGQYFLKIHPYKNGGVSLFKMKDILLVPVK